MIGNTKNSKEAGTITLPTLPKAHMFRYVLETDSSKDYS